MKKITTEKLEPPTRIPRVIHFQRKPRPGFNFSIEQIFQRLRELLAGKVEFSVQYSSHFNDGYFSKIWNIPEAGKRVDKKAVLHITGETHFLNLLMPKKNVLLTIHDCRYMERKKGWAKKITGWLYLRAPVKKAAYITTVSGATKKDVIRYTGCSPDKIHVVPVSVNKVFQPSPKIFNAACPVILQVGAGENKNLERLADALSTISCQLVIVGQPADHIIEKMKLLKIDFLVKHNLSNAALYDEYVHCDIVSFVSTFEGFGMPIVEANCVERVVLTSNISSMPEVAGNAACLVNPYAIEDIRAGFLKIIHDASYREQLIKNGRQNRQRFDESLIAASYYKLYQLITSQIHER
jgi:glycosyltransferase involved in cell wall biosynthesis